MFPRITSLILILLYNIFATSAKPNKLLMHQDYTYLQSTNSYYKFHDESNTWQNAVAACSSEGAQLYYPEDMTEAKEVARTLDIWQNVSSIWIGVSDLQEVTNYKTIDGRPVSDVFHNWNEGEPSSGKDGLYHCVIMWFDYTLTVHQNNRLWNFICKYTPQTKTALDIISNESAQSTKNLAYQDYTYIKSTNSYYKYYGENKTWHDAVAACSSEGAQLFYPEDIIEATEVEKVLDIWKNTVLIWIGVSDLQEVGNYKTIDGRPISEVHHRWMPGEPTSGKNGSYHCVVLWFNNKLMVFQKDRLIGFVCKYTPETRISNQDYNTVTIPSETVLDTTTECKSCSTHSNKKLRNQDFAYLESNNYYYKYYDEKKTWHDARATCSSEGGQLLYPYDETEATEVGKVLDIWKNTSLIWIEVSDLQELRNYTTIDGRPISYRFHPWSSGEPSSGEHGSGHCVVMWFDNTLMALECNRLFHFVCKYESIPGTKFISQDESTVTTPSEKVSDTTSKSK